MSRLTIVANIHAKPDQVDLVKSELKKLIPTTRAEKGCINYDLHQDNTDPTHFVFYENWESRDLWQAHMNAPHMEAYGAATAGKVDEFVVNEMTEID
ncbi:putative quinol monooxygenase [Salinispora oceanensis]|uniref:putative quinol monooxygenase n=1 Tax=Salinispora oceanensis TaxID=1050199 RepID=UPI0003624CDD|nr:putative quinol monooxygenase [Salinispora oceanensis]